VEQALSPALFMAIRKLTPAVHDKVWGSALTEPRLANPAGRKIGEIWFSAPEALPVLVKLLFTTENLSVQVHPGDNYARSHGHLRGKTEMWHVLCAAPGATIACGLKKAITGERLRESAVSGEIVDLLDWIPASEGDTFFLPAGTIHAIGGGLALCEVQQFSDVTYRLFDYHRKPERELHLDDGVAVSVLVPTPNGRREMPVECEYFRTELLIACGITTRPAYSGPAICIALAGEGQIAGEPFRAGDAWLVEAGTGLAIDSPDAAFIVASGV
jgi:mannose-6-phosphate isomerase